MAFYGIKTKIDSEGKPISIGFRYPDASYKVRLLDSKEFYTEGTSIPGLFGMDKFTPGVCNQIAITEGELDAASLHQCLGIPVVSVHSSASAARDVGSLRSELNTYERIYLAFDGDVSGRDAAAKVAHLFDYGKVYHLRFDSRRKDANEYVRHGEERELRTLWQSSKHYLPDTVRSSFSDFKEILKGELRESVPYPFPKLTEMTYGIRTGESVLITAQEGVGKTELMHALEYQLLTRTKDNVGAIFLEEPPRRHLQALAGIHLQCPAHLPDRGCSNDETYSALEEVLARDDRLHVYTYFGSDDPEILLDTIRFLVAVRSCRYILLDHVSMVVSGRSEDDERRTLDWLSTKLEMMVKELDFSLIIVSHVNDFGQTRGSRYISKIADIRIDLERDVVSGSNITHVRVSKNRFCGRTGPSADLVFNPHKYIYKESANDNDNVSGHRDPGLSGSSTGHLHQQEGARLDAA